MSCNRKYFLAGRVLIFFFLLLIAKGAERTLFESWPVFGSENKNFENKERRIYFESSKELEKELIIIQKNSLFALSNSFGPKPKPVKRLKAVITAYSSTPWETDETPHITASGKKVREGIVANNILPFGTKIRIPELYGDKIFVVEDRMSWKKGNYQIDIWFPDYQKALNFGVRKTYIEILEG